MTGTAWPYQEEGRHGWIYLLFAGLLEIVWAVSMKQSEGFTRLTPPCSRSSA